MAKFDVRKVLVLPISALLGAVASACNLYAEDHPSGLPDMEVCVDHWTVVNESTGAELGSGCSENTGRDAQLAEVARGEHVQVMLMIREGGEIVLWGPSSGDVKA